MAIDQIIYWCNLIIWLVPPFRQYGKKYFSFFLILAVMDPLTRSINLYFNIHPLKSFFVLSILLILALLEIKGIKKFIYYSVSTAIFIIISLNINVHTTNALIIIMHLVVLIIVITQFVIWINNKQNINVFIIALVLYETSIIMKFYLYLTKDEHYIVYYYITTAFEILLGLFFIFFKSDDKRIHLRLYNETPPVIPGRM